MPKTIIKPRQQFSLRSFKEILHYRDLLLTLAYRDFRVRYAQTLLGFLWAFIQPLFTLGIFYLIFSQAIQIDTGNVPYLVFALTGLSAWSYFAFVMSQSGGSIINAQEMVKKIYFPRLIIPLSKAIVGLVDFAVVSLFLIIMMIYHGVVLQINALWVPVFIIAILITSLSIGIWLSALSIRYRDFQHVIPFMVQIGLYATPVAYPAEFILQRLPDWAQVVFFLNPMAGVIEGLRWALFGLAEPNPLMWVSMSIVIVLFFTGIYYFKKVERDMADIV